MKRNELRWFAAVPTVATGLASIVLGALTLNGFASPANGDLAVSATRLNGMTMGILLAALILVGLALAHVTSRRLRLACAPETRLEARPGLA